MIEWKMLDKETNTFEKKKTKLVEYFKIKYKVKLSDSEPVLVVH